MTPEELINIVHTEKARPQATVVALSGDLGAGKTTFTQQVAKLLGVTETVTSPTFVIEKIYKIQSPRFIHLIHIDAYRLERETELVALGWNDIVRDPKNLICIEWPERVPGLLPKDHILIKLQHHGQ